MLTVAATPVVPAALGSLRRLRTEDGRLTARPLRAVHEPLGAGEHVMSEVGGRRTVLVVPSSAKADRPAPLIVMLHGATEDSGESLGAMRDVAERDGVYLLTPSSAGVTWDAIRGRFGDDLEDIDRQLARIFEHCAIDPARLAVAGFSDGASYAVSLGIINGDLFTHVIAYSAGFIIPGLRHGTPRVFMAHGTRDQILPIDQCGRRIAGILEAAGYSVDFNEFDGPHMIRPEMVDRSMAWFLKR